MLHLVLVSLLAATTASDAPPPPPPEIVVQGIRDRDQAIHDFVGAVTPAPIGGQLSRFDWQACPAAVGLTEEQNRRVVARLRQVATAVGIPLAAAGCRPNVLAIAVDGKDEFVAALRKKYPAYFSTVQGGTIPTPHEKGPAVAWHIGGLMTADHISASTHTPTGSNPGRYYVVESTDASRLLPASIPHFLGGVLVVELQALAGLSTQQFADYAALRLYAATRPDKLKPTADSILGVLEAPPNAEVPASMTAWDFAFLKGLYHSDDRQFAWGQRGDIEHTIKHDNR